MTDCVQEHPVIAIYDSRAAADTAAKALQRADLDLKRLSYRGEGAGFQHRWQWREMSDGESGIERRIFGPIRKNENQTDHVARYSTLKADARA